MTTKLGLIEYPRTGNVYFFTRKNGQVVVLGAFYLHTPKKAIHEFPNTPSLERLRDKKTRILMEVKA